MKVVAVYNAKGGVGKTAAAVSLAYLAARDGAATLLWDLDPQGAASYVLRVRGGTGAGARKVIRGKADLRSQLRATGTPGLYLLPSDFSYRKLDLALDEAGRPEKRLAQRLRPLRHRYDLVVLDCPPSVSLTSEAVFGAAGALLVPTIPTPLSLRTLEQLASHLERAGASPAVWPFLTMADRRKRIHREILESPPQRPFPFLDTVIPYASAVERMAAERAPLPAFAPRSVAAAAYRALWGEVSTRLRLLT